MQARIAINETALIVIDVINSCCHENCETRNWGVSFKKIRRMVPALNAFISAYRLAGGRVIFVDCTPWTKAFLPRNLVELYENPRCRYYSSDASGFPEKFFGVSPEKGDGIVTKNTYDAFTNPKLDKILRKQKAKCIIIAGVFGEGCVHSTIQGAFSKGYNLIILKDLIETTDVKARQRLQALLKDYTWPVMFGKTLNSKDFFRLVR